MTACFRGGTIVPSLTSSDKYEAIRELIHRAPIFAKVANVKKIEEAVILREHIHSTSLGHGVAIAHGATLEVNRIIIALGISEKGIDFGSIDKIPVHLLFVITSPPEKKVEYLIALAAVTRLVRDDSFRKSLNATVPCQEIEKKIYRAFHSCLKKYNKIVV